MAISFEKALGVHEKALSFRAQRGEVLANNIANADTPNYKARDIEFSSVLSGELGKRTSPGLERTHSKHIAADGVSLSEQALSYRTAGEPSIDQNTVDVQVEQGKYAENAVHFQASFTLLNSKFKGLLSALRGE